MKFSNTKRRRAPAVIIVSLIDVLLVVLIFLMVTTTLRKLEPSFKVALAQASEAKLGAEDTKAFVITIATNFPYFYLENLPITFDRLQKELMAAAATNPELRVDVKADKNSPFGEYMKVMNAAKLAKVGSINTITEKAASP